METELVVYLNCERVQQVADADPVGHFLSGQLVEGLQQVLKKTRVPSSSE